MRIKKLFKFNRPVNLLGIDIRQNFIRLVELSYFNSKYRLEACVNFALNATTISDEIIIKAIKNILEQISSKTTLVAIALPHTIIIFDEVQIALELSSKEIEEFLRFNFMEHIKEPKESINLDYHIIETISNENLAKIQAVAVRQGWVERWVKLLRQANLNPKIIDIDVYALERAIRMQLKNIEELIAVVNIDYGHILIIVLDRRKIVYMHEDIIKNESLLSIEQILELLDLKLRLICSVLSRPVNRLILGGEKATLPSLIDALNGKLDIQIAPANPFLGMELSASVTQESATRLSPLMLISCGLALRVGDNDED